jgi:hypothetical protein
LGAKELRENHGSPPNKRNCRDWRPIRLVVGPLDLEPPLWVTLVAAVDAEKYDG